MYKMKKWKMDKDKDENIDMKTCMCKGQNCVSWYVQTEMKLEGIYVQQ
jgi:hypothetical protein